MTRHTSPDAKERAGRVKMILLDVDGVLTDGRIYYGTGDYDGRAFHARDGHGIRLGQRGGLLFGIISGRRCEVVARRAAELDIAEVHQKISDKLDSLRAIMERAGLPAEAVCYVGDDLIDVPVMRRVGLAAAPADAAPEVREIAQLVTLSGGGHGAVREVVDYVLRATGNWEKATDGYLKDE